MTHVQTPEFIPAIDLLTDIGDARRYIERRLDDAMQLDAEIRAQWQPGGLPGTLVCTPYPNLTLVQDLTGNRLHATPCWGDVYWLDADGREQMELAHTYQQALAFILAKFW